MSLSIVIDLLVLLIAVILHEVAHGYVAFRFGDPTAKQEGRLSLSPLPHIDPIGSLILPALLIFSGSSFIIGWAKPVPVQARYFRNPLKDMMWVAAAGPLTNISIAVVSSVLLKLLVAAQLHVSLVGAYGVYFLQSSIVINLVLAVFNLVPVPPLDGSKIILPFLPLAWRLKYGHLERYGLLIVLLLVFFGVFGKVLGVLLPPLLRILM